MRKSICIPEIAVGDDGRAAHALAVLAVVGRAVAAVVVPVQHDDLLVLGVAGRRPDDLAVATLRRRRRVVEHDIVHESD